MEFDRFFLGITAKTGVHEDQQQVIRVESHISMLRSCERFQKQAASDQQYSRQRNLANDQSMARQPPIG